MKLRYIFYLKKCDYDQMSPELLNKIFTSHNYPYFISSVYTDVEVYV